MHEEEHSWKECIRKASALVNPVSEKENAKKVSSKKKDLSDWSIENPLGAILVEQPLGYLKWKKEES